MLYHYPDKIKDNLCRRIDLGALIYSSQISGSMISMHSTIHGASLKVYTQLTIAGIKPDFPCYALPLF
jgi:hypothetical protein